jgi:hypothetical protein
VHGLAAAGRGAHEVTHDGWPSKVLGQEHILLLLGVRHVDVRREVCCRMRRVLNVYPGSGCSSHRSSANHPSAFPLLDMTCSNSVHTTPWPLCAF